MPKGHKNTYFEEHLPTTFSVNKNNEIPSKLAVNKSETTTIYNISSTKLSESETSLLKKD